MLILTLCDSTGVYNLALLHLPPSFPYLCCAAFCHQTTRPPPQSAISYRNGLGQIVQLYRRIVSYRGGIETAGYRTLIVSMGDDLVQKTPHPLSYSLTPFIHFPTHWALLCLAYQLYPPSPTSAINRPVFFPYPSPSPSSSPTLPRPTGRHIQATKSHKYPQYDPFPTRVSAF